MNSLLNSNKIYFSSASESIWIRDLNPLRPSVQRIESDVQNNQRRPDSSTIEIVRSPSDVINRYVLNQIPDEDLTDKFGDPSHRYEPKYFDLCGQWYPDGTMESGISERIGGRIEEIKYFELEYS